MPLIIACVIVLLSFGGLDAFVLARRQRYEAEIARLRASMSELERQRADALIAGEKHKLRVALELARRQARIDPALHLSVALDSGAMYLEQEGALLRRMLVQIGPERRVGVPPDTVPLAPPKGVRVIAAILSDSSRWEVPEWVYLDRGLPIPSADQRMMTGALGPALLLDGGTVIYSPPSSGPLADSTYVLPGAVRATREDLRAMLPGLSPGTRVYFY